MVSVSEILSDGSNYVKEGLIEKWQRWVILIVLLAIQTVTMSIVPLFNGYLVKVYSNSGRGAPDIADYKSLFINGWKLNIVTLLYMIPALIVALIMGVLSVAPIIAGIMSEGRIDEVRGIVLGSVGLLVTGLVIALITLIMYMAFVHFSRSGKIVDAFHISAIASQISNGIGWGKYVIIWIFLWILSMILFIIVMGFNVIPPLGTLIGVLISPLWAVFMARVICDAYYNEL